MTIVEAIIKSLNTHPDGLTAEQIYNEIVSNNYYSFGAKNPLGVVEIQIKRYCENTRISKSSSIKYFLVSEVDGKKLYKLKAIKGEYMDRNKRYSYIDTVINGIRIYTFCMPMADLAMISYVAVRGKDSEEGAVQRVLNKQRISSIKKYVLAGNMFVNTFVLNWTNTSEKPTFDNGEIDLPLICGAAQLIDGQHRLEGLKAAALEDYSINEKVVIVSLAINLKTEDAAKIFLNINSEQRPVPRSLIYDLYGVTAEDRNYAINRSKDIADKLNEDEDSPFYQAIKYPGSPRGKGKLDLSTVVNAIKPYVEKNGKFEENNIKDFNIQYTILQNYYSALKYHADKTKKWSTLSLNIFFKAAGFIGGTEFFFEYVLPKCVSLKSFKQETISSMFNFDECELIIPKEIETTDGRTARKKVTENLKLAFISDIPDEGDYDL